MSPCVQCFKENRSTSRCLIVKLEDTKNKENILETLEKKCIRHTRREVVNGITGSKNAAEMCLQNSKEKKIPSYTYNPSQTIRRCNSRIKIFSDLSTLKKIAYHTSFSRKLLASYSEAVIPKTEIGRICEIGKE